MKYANIDMNKVYISENLEKATEYIKTTTSGDIYAIVNFDYVEPFNKLMNVGDK